MSPVVADVLLFVSDADGCGIAVAVGLTVADGTAVFAGTGVAVLVEEALVPNTALSTNDRISFSKEEVILSEYDCIMKKNGCPL